MAEAGIEAVFILNIEPEDRLLRLEDRAMEFIWRPMYSHLARRAELLGHVFYDFYTSPLQFRDDMRQVRGIRARASREGGGSREIERSGAQGRGMTA